MPPRTTPQLFEERISSPVLSTLALLFIAASAGLAIAGFRSELQQKDLLTTAAIMAGIGLTLANFRLLIIRITAERLEVRFGLFRSRTRLADIVQMQPDAATFHRYLGVGLRYGRDGSLAWVPRFGPAVRFARRNSHFPLVVFSTRNPEAMLAAIRKIQRTAS